MFLCHKGTGRSSNTLSVICSLPRQGGFSVPGYWCSVWIQVFPRQEMEELLSCMDVTELWAPGCPQTLALAGHQPSPPHTQCRSLGEATSFCSCILMKNRTDDHPRTSLQWWKNFVPWYPSKPHYSSPLLTPTLSRCCSGLVQGSQTCPHTTLARDSCLKHLKHSMLLFWQLDLILDNWAVLAKWGPLKRSVLQPLNLLTFVPIAPASPRPHSSSKFSQGFRLTQLFTQPNTTCIPTALADSSMKLHSAQWSKLTERWNSCSAVFHTAAP